MASVSDIRICSYFIPSDRERSDDPLVDRLLDALSLDLIHEAKGGGPKPEFNVDQIVKPGTHIYCLQTEDKCSSPSYHPVIERLRQQNFTVVNANTDRAFIAFDSTRFTAEPLHDIVPYDTIMTRVNDNVTGKNLLISSTRVSSSAEPGITTLSTAAVNDSIALLRSRCSVNFVALPSGATLEGEIPEGFEQRDGGLLQFQTTPEELPVRIPQRIFSVVQSIVTFVQSIFMTTYGTPAYTLETQASADGSRQPFMTRITFPEQASLISRITEWFRHVLGCSAQVPSAVQIPN